MHLTTSPVDWYAARAGGLVAYALLSAVVLLGITMGGRKKLERWPRFAIEDVHRAGGLLVGVFIAIHVVTIAIDAYLPFSLSTIVIPFIAAYRPIWVGLGIVAAELLLALAVVNHYRDSKVSYETWRKLHYVNFAVWIAATFHGLGSGTDRSTYWLLAIYGIAVVAVAAAIAWRVVSRHGEPAVAMMMLSGGAAATLLLILATGPLHFKPRPWNAPNFNEDLSGQIVRSNGLTRGLVSLTGEGRGIQHVVVRADLLISPKSTIATSFQMEFLPSGMVCKGTITAVRSLGFDARCRPPNGPVHVVTAAWADSGSSRFQGGTLTSKLAG